MELLHFLAQYRTPVGEVFFQWVTYLGQEMFVVAVICWLFWCSNKRLAFSLGFAYFTSGLLIQGLKITFRIPRPWILDPDFQPVASALSGATGYSFPSGHTQSITALFCTLSMHLKKTAGKFFCFLIVFAVMFSRMYLGCHTPKDVCVSFVLTLLCVFFSRYFFYIKDVLNGREGIAALLMTAACILLSAYAVILEHSGTIDMLYAQDCLKASGAGVAFALGYYIEKRYLRFSVPTDLSHKLSRLLIGLLVTVAIQQGLKPVMGASLPACFFRYFLVVFWILVIYPLLFTKASKKREALS